MKNITEELLLVFEKKQAVMLITKDYIDGSKGVENIIERLDELMNFKEDKTFEEKVGGISAGFEMLSEIFLLKKLKDNPDDMRVLVEKAKDMAEMVMDCYE